MKHYELKHEFCTLRFLGRNKDFSLGYFYDAKNRKIIEFNICKNKRSLEYFWKLVGYIGIQSRRNKYLGVYNMFEEFGSNPRLEWRAVRVSMSHSERKITEPKLVSFLRSSFGELVDKLEKFNENWIISKHGKISADTAESKVIKLVKDDFEYVFDEKKTKEIGQEFTQIQQALITIQKSLAKIS